MLTQPLNVALVGNPNTGKTTLFNELSGLRQRVGNYPGVTVELKKGTARDGDRAFQLIDLPGTYSLAPRSPDELLAVDLLLGHCPGEPRPDVILAVVDASNLDRHLYLVTQLMELNRSVVVALNMCDIADRQGQSINASLLSEKLGVPVVSIQANEGKGLADLKRAVWSAAQSESRGLKPEFPDLFQCEAATLAKSLPGVDSYVLERLLIDVNGETERRLSQRFGPPLIEQVKAARQRLAAAGHPVPMIESRTRYAWIKAITAQCVVRPAQRHTSWTDRLDRILTHRVVGTLVFLAVMAIMFQSIFTWAKPLMKWIGDGKGMIGDWLRTQLPAGPFTSLLTDGILEGVGSVVVFLPQIMILFAFIAVLEDCGYMARAAFLMDKLMSRCGLSGKSFIPLLSSVACAVPGIMATRVIEDRRDRLATILVAPLMSCSARLPVYVLLIGAFLTVGHSWWLPGVTLFAMYAIGLIIAPLVALLFKRTILRGVTPAFIMELPIYKRPSLHTVLRRMFDAAWAFLRRAGTLILASMILVWALLYFPWWDAQGRRYEDLISAAGPDSEQAHVIEGQWKRQSLLGQLGQAIEPVVAPLGWDWRIGVAALASFPAREVVVGTLGIIYQEGKVEADSVREAEWAEIGETGIGKALREAKWDGAGTPVFTIPTVLSLLVFFALCCQCVSTLAVIRRETHSWGWPALTFGYMTALAYIAALVVYQIGIRIV